MGKCPIQKDEITQEWAYAKVKESLEKHYSSDDISIGSEGVSVSGNLSASFERAITNANVRVSIEDGHLSYRAAGKASIGKWAYVWFFLGCFTGVFLIWFGMDLFLFIISRDRPKQHFEEAFKAIEFEVT